MRMSCNGCRVLRKGCSENCSIRPCLALIKSPEAQANATVFLAKFYGRAGLMNLINAGPEHLRPAIFRSLLYEACGRIVNPIHGSVGLLWSGSWQLCQAAVEAVLKGAPITSITSDAAAASGQEPLLKAYDIRHVSRDHEPFAASKCRSRANRGSRTKTRKLEKEDEELNGSSTSHDSVLSHQSELAAETESAASLAEEEEEIGLELRLGFEPVVARECHVVPLKKRKMVGGVGTCEAFETCQIELGLGKK